LIVKEDGKAYQGDRLLDGEKIKYAMDGLGNTYTDMNDALFHHSSFFSDGRVAAAGEITAKSGRITAINNGSGHYKPTTKHTDQAVKELRSRGVNVSNIERNEHTATQPHTRYYRDVDDTFISRKKKY